MVDHQTTATPSGTDYHAALVAALPDAVLVADAHGRCLDANPAATALLGYRLDELRCLQASDLIAAPLEWRAAAGRGIITAGRWRGELDLRLKDGTLVPVTAQVSLVPGPAGPIYAAMLRDASPRRLEAAIQAVSDALPIGIMLMDGAGRCVYANPRCQAIGGFSPAAARGDGWIAFVHPDDRATLLAARRDAAADSSFEGEYRFQHPDGSERWVFIQGTPVTGERGTPRHVVVQLQDVTVRKEAEAERERLAAIVESAEDAIIGRDLDGIITSWNDGAQRLFGYTAAEAIGQSVAMLSPAEIMAELPEFLARVRRGERVEGHETRRITRDGRIMHVSVTISPVRDSQGHIAGASVIARDISARKRLEELRRDFLAMVTHDLRTPLTSVRGFAQLLQRRGAYHPGTVEAILAETDRMRRLIDDLADLVRLDAGKLDLRRAPVDLADLARREAAAIQTQAERHTIRVLAPDGPVSGEWDAGRIGQVLQNLLTNAVKYSPAGGTVTVTVSIAAAGAEARLAVHDDGPGIAEAHLPLLFERFYRSGTTGAGGLGLGLSIARMLVEAHGGRITAASKPGRGSTFTVTLPVR